MFVIIMIIINMAAILSIRFARRKFNMLEICAYWMLNCAVIQQVFTIITINLQMIEVSEGVGVFWYLVMNRLVLMPSLIIWLFYFSKDVNIIRKAIFMGAWLLVLSGIQLLSKTFGMIAYVNWNVGYSLAEWFMVLFATTSFFLWFRHILKKEEFIV
ncbi:hypothetical protein [Paenibacillus aestuarii]|uniref:Uncharacterized protein n=1 Tax=Paenibacillus aestuarii TaxID=516965 RepID=A0ABW0KGC4_9BACL|nr:hypothetical protein [Paenibacillus aestuarii]